MIACHVTPEKKQQMSAAFWAKLALLFSTNTALMMMFVVANWCTFSLGGNEFVKISRLGWVDSDCNGRRTYNNHIPITWAGWPNFILSI